jgi:hypothetical protein
MPLRRRIRTRNVQSLQCFDFATSDSRSVTSDGFQRFLHGARNDESSYSDQNSKQMVKLAEQYGYLLRAGFR